MKADRVAVELNRDIVPRDQWAETKLPEGDRLEIVHFVGGGCVAPATDDRELSVPPTQRARNSSSHPFSPNLH